MIEKEAGRERTAEKGSLCSRISTAGGFLLQADCYYLHLGLILIGNGLYQHLQKLREGNTEATEQNFKKFSLFAPFDGNLSSGNLGVHESNYTE